METTRTPCFTSDDEALSPVDRLMRLDEGQRDGINGIGLLSPVVDPGRVFRSGWLN